MRPSPAPSFVLIVLGSVETCDRDALVSTNSALTTRRGCPATVTVKSPAARPRIGTPCRSMTPTSTVTSSTLLLNVGTGGWAGCCASSVAPLAAAAAAPIAHTDPLHPQVFMALPFRLLRVGRQVSLPRADVVVALAHADLDVSPLAVLLVVERKVRQNVLVGQFRDDLVEDGIELAGVLGEERLPAGRSRVGLERGAQLRNRRAAPEADGVEHGVARL